MSRLRPGEDRATERALADLIHDAEVEAALASPASDPSFEAAALDRMRAHAQAHPHRGAGPRPRAWFWGGLVAAAAAALVLATIGASPGDAERASTSSDEAAAESPSTTSDRPAYLSADPRSDAAVQVQGTEVTWDVDGAVTAAFAVQHWSSSDEATRVSLGSQLVWEARAQLGRAPLPGEVVVVEWRTEDSSTRRLSWFAPDRRED